MRATTPTFYFENIFYLDKEFFEKNNIDALILDVDNTLISNTVNDADEKLSKWIMETTNSGIKLCIVSNGKGKRVKQFNKPFGIPAVFEALKPSSKGFLQALKLLGTKKENTVVVGDQLFTDILGGNRCGLRTILVKPIDENEQLFIRLKRYFERPLISRLTRKGVIK